MSCPICVKNRASIEKFLSMKGSEAADWAELGNDALFDIPFQTSLQLGQSTNSLANPISAPCCLFIIFTGSYVCSLTSLGHRQTKAVKGSVLKHIRRSR